MNKCSCPFIFFYLTVVLFFSPFLWREVGCEAFSQQRKIDSLLLLSQTSKEDTSKIKYLNNLSKEYVTIASYDSALNYAEAAIQLSHVVISEKRSPVIYQVAQKALANSYHIIGTIYREQGNYSKALDYYLKALKIDEELGNKNGIARHLGNIGGIYRRLNEYSSALRYFFKALKMDEELGNIKGIARHMNNIGITYKNQGDYSNAQYYYFKALKIEEELGNKNGIARIMSNIGLVYQNHKNYEKAEEYMLKALGLSKETGYLPLVSNVNNNLSELYEKTAKPAKALEYYKQYVVIKDSLFNADKNKEIIQKIMNYEFEKKEAVAKAEQDKKDAVVAEEKQKQKIIIWSVVAGLLLVAIILIIVIQSLRITRKQKKIIEFQKKEIVDSVIYAKRIQQAILPKKNLIQEKLPQSFILYEPKDIVSGDFYWFAEQAHSLFIVASDCTGHGIPGALMSMVASDTITLVIKEKNIYEPMLILEQVNKEIKQKLKQNGDENETRDGMDMALCKINMENKTLQYAGANRPLYLFRKGELKEFAANKIAIGGFTDDNYQFQDHSIAIEPGDTMYIFTDGYADQFGGKNRKKFMTKRFKELLLSIQDKSMPEQEVILAQTISDWRGSIEQIDDILVIGIRL